MDAVNPGSYVAFYLSPDSFEMFFFCYVNDVRNAPEMMFDYYNHTIEKGSMYLKCNCLQQKFIKKRNVLNNILRKTVYVLPGHIVNPFVFFNDGLSMSASYYQSLNDSILIYFKNIYFQNLSKPIMQNAIISWKFSIKIKMDENNQVGTFSFSLRNHSRRYQLYFHIFLKFFLSRSSYLLV